MQFLYRVHYYQTTKQGCALTVAEMRCALGTDIGLLHVLYMAVACFLVTVETFKAYGHVMLHQFNIPQLYALPTLYLCVLYLSENKERLVPLTA